MKLGDFIKDVLDKKKISQVDLAQRINLTPAQVSRIISGERGTSIETKDDQPLFSSRQTGAPLTRTRLLKMVVAIGNRAGVKGVSLHRFRHTFAISYLRNRGDVYTLQRLLGHSTLDMVKNYLAIVQVDIENAYNLASPVGNWGL